MIQISAFICRSTLNSLLFSANLSFHSKALPSFSRKMHSSNAIRAAQTIHQVPNFESAEMELIAEQTFARYTFDGVPQRRGKGVAIVWFRNDLRVLDNEVLLKAWASSEVVLPVYCVDPRLFGSTYYFGFPKTGALRAQFLIECLSDLKRNLTKRGLNLLIQHGKPEQVLPYLAKAYGVHTVYAQKETCSEELSVERSVSKNLQKVNISSAEGKSKNSTKLELVWGSTMYHIDDLPFSCTSIPDVYTQFRKSVETKSRIRNCMKLPASLGPTSDVTDWGCVPDISSLGLKLEKVSKGMAFFGGENAAISRVHEYFWKKDLLRTYKLTRNGMLGPDYSTKFSAWLASGSLSPRFIHEEVKRYEKQREANDSTYWVLFELVWRDYFRFLSIKQGNSIFHAGGPRNVRVNWSQDRTLFDAWRDGETGYPLIDANMKELSTTGFMSNRGRQTWVLTGEWELNGLRHAFWTTTLVPTMATGHMEQFFNITAFSSYFLGVGNDPREDRYFSIPKQAQNYDPDGEFVVYWLPQLRPLPKEKRQSPGMMYIKPVVALKFGNTKPTNNRMASGTRRISTQESKGKNIRQ